MGTVFPLYKSILGSMVSGRIEKMHCEIGDSVLQGQVVADIDQTLFDLAVIEAKDAQAAAAVEVQDAERNFERMKKLFEKTETHAPAISQKRFEDAQIRLDQARISKDKADLLVKRAQKNLEETRIQAPYEGVITKKFVDPGELVSPGVKIAEIIATKRVFVEFCVPHVLVSKLTQNHPLTIWIDGHEKPYSTFLDRMYPDVDEKTRSVRCRTYLDNLDGKLKTGSFVTVSFVCAEG